MRNRLFYVQNAGHTMRNTVLYFYSHCVILLIYRKLLCMLWNMRNENEKLFLVGYWVCVFYAI